MHNRKNETLAQVALTPYGLCDIFSATPDFANPARPVKENS
jgi:hypothetical protein